MRERVGVLERRRRQRGDVLLGEAGLRVLVRLAGVLRDVGGLDPVERGQRRAGVLGVARRPCRLQRLEGDLLGAEVELLLDLEAGGLERLGVDLAEDVLLGEVLRADRDRGLPVAPASSGCSSPACVRLGARARRRTLSSSSSPQAATTSRGQRRPAAPAGRDGCVSRVCILLLGDGRRDGGRRAAAFGALEPFGVTARWSSANSRVGGEVTSATTIARAELARRRRRRCGLMIGSPSVVDADERRDRRGGDHVDTATCGCRRRSVGSASGSSTRRTICAPGHAHAARGVDGRRGRPAGRRRRCW